MTRNNFDNDDMENLEAIERLECYTSEDNEFNRLMGYNFECSIYGRRDRRPWGYSKNELTMLMRMRLKKAKINGVDMRDIIRKQPTIIKFQQNGVCKIDFENDTMSCRDMTGMEYYRHRIMRKMG